MEHYRGPIALDRGARVRRGLPGTGVLAPLMLLWLVAVVAVGCDDSGGSTSSSGTGANTGSNLTAPQQYGGSYRSGSATGDTEAGAAFARWVLDQDPQRQYITDSVVRNEQSLGVKVQPNITKADAQRLLVALTEGMARTFPGKSLNVIAFYQSGDKLAEANYDASSKQVNVQFTQ